MPERFGEFNDKLVFFSFYTGTQSGSNPIGLEPCITDGTLAGSKYIKNICTGTSSNCGLASFNLTRAEYGTLNNKLYFPAAGPDGIEPYISDGTIPGTQILKDINPNGDSDAQYFFDYNGKLYFQADDGTNGVELWVTDGTNAGTQMLKNINPNGDSNPHSFTLFKGQVIFSATDAAHGTEIWSSDGTTAGTILLTEINSTGNGNPMGYIEFNNELIFFANDGSAAVPQLWKSNGIAGNKTKLADTYPFPQFSHINERPFTLFKGKLYFQGKDTLDGFEPWYTDGTASGTNILKDIFPYNNMCNQPMKYVVYDNKLYMNVHNIYWNLYVTDGTQQGTIAFNSIDNGTKLKGASYFLTVYNRKLYFIGEDSTNQQGLFESNGKPSNTMCIKPPGSVDALWQFPRDMKMVNGALYIAAHYDNNGLMLWKYSTPAPLSIKNNNKEKTLISISPNPVSDILNIQFEKPSNAAYKILLTDLLGRRINITNKSLAGSKISIDVSRFVNGTYICQVISEGVTVDHKKIVVSH